MQGLECLVERLRHRGLEEYLDRGRRLLGLALLEELLRHLAPVEYLDRLSRLLACLEEHLKQLPLEEYLDRDSRLVACSGVHRKRRVGQFLVHLPLVPIRMPHRLGFSVQMPRHKLS